MLLSVSFIEMPHTQTTQSPIYSLAVYVYRFSVCLHSSLSLSLLHSLRLVKEADDRVPEG